MDDRGSSRKLPGDSSHPVVCQIVPVNWHLTINGSSTLDFANVTAAVTGSVTLKQTWIWSKSPEDAVKDAVASGALTLKRKDDPAGGVPVQFMQEGLFKLKPIEWQHGGGDGFYDTYITGQSILDGKWNAGCIHVRIDVPWAEADVDSANADGFAKQVVGSNHAKAEDKDEDDAAKPGKFVAVNDADQDHDGVPDFADGFNADGKAGNADDTPPAGDAFVPVTFTFNKAIDVTKARLKISYSASDPSKVQPTLASGEPGYRLPAEGALRLWANPAATKRTAANFTTAPGSATQPALGYYVAPGEYGPSDLAKLGLSGANRTVTLWLEAVSPSQTAGDQRVEFDVDPGADSGGKFVAADAVRVTAVRVDADVDSDNNNAFNAPARSVSEDQIEAAAKDANGKDQPGKVVLVNEGDLDGDGVLDDADGFNADGIAGNADDAPPTAAQGEHFVPLVIDLPTPLDLAKVRLQIDYDASVPGAGPGGSFRLWTKDGDVARSRETFTTAGGTYVPKKAGGDFYSPADLAKLGLTGGTRSVTLYVEAVSASAAAGDKTVTVRVDPDGDGPAGFVAADVVRMTVVRVDLDVDGNKSLDDAADGTVTYLPGYEGKTAKVSTGKTFNAPAYVGQQMKLLVQGLGSGTTVDGITFKVEDVTAFAGYAGNASNPKVEGAGKDDDFSFQELANDRDEAGTMEAGKTSAAFWAKDYGGWAKVKVEAKIGGNTFTLREFTVPNDSDGDKLADTWERAKVKDWNKQFGTAEKEDPAFFAAADDKELKDPDGANTDGGTDMNEQATAGDGRDVSAEYRGYILDGGGFDWDGANGHNGGHVRLSPAYKELLVEVDAMDGVANLPARAGIATWMDAVSKGISQKADGAGFRMYYLFDNLATGHFNDFDSNLAVHNYISGTRSLNDFTHLQFASDLGSVTWGATGGQTFGDRQTSIGVDWLWNKYPGFWGMPAPAWSPTFDGFVEAYISHELHHTYAWNIGDDFAVGGHIDDTDGDGVGNQPGDFEYVLYDYNHIPRGPYLWQDYAHIKYGAGTTKSIDIR
jgi:hypothetical protein